MALHCLQDYSWVSWRSLLPTNLILCVTSCLTTPTGCRFFLSKWTKQDHGVETIYRAMQSEPSILRCANGQPTNRPAFSGPNICKQKGLQSPQHIRAAGGLQSINVHAKRDKRKTSLTAAPSSSKLHWLPSPAELPGRTLCASPWSTILAMNHLQKNQSGCGRQQHLSDIGFVGLAQ